ncbi:hypothetical protein E3T29_16750 [Cryobacterium sp. TMT1-66-1]|nr:hypothetical protein E3T29_16750 [Cryobacterium sp. TMT1-66-1]
MSRLGTMLTLSVSALRDRRHTCLAVDRWAEEVAAGAPYVEAGALVDAARRAATPLSGAEVDEALAGHPHIGQAPTGAGAAQQFSRREQASADADDTELAALLAAGNRDYEARFGRVFLIRAAPSGRRAGRDRSLRMSRHAATSRRTCSTPSPAGPRRELRSRWSSASAPRGCWSRPAKRMPTGASPRSARRRCRPAGTASASIPEPGSRRPGETPSTRR